MIPFIVIGNNKPILRSDLKAPRRRGRAVKLTPDMPIGDRIYLRPDWPPIGSADFAEKLREWHAQYNAQLEAA